MKKVLSGLLVLFVFCAFAGSASAFDLDSVLDQSSKFRSGKLKLDSYVKSLQKTLDNSEGDVATRTEAFSSMWEAFANSGKLEKAEEVAQKAIDDGTLKDSPLGNQLMSQVKVLQQDIDGAKEYMNKAMAQTKNADLKKAMQEGMDSLPHRINDATPLFSSFDESTKKALKKFQNKQITYTGVVTEIDKDGSGAPYIMFGVNSDNSAGVRACLDKEPNVKVGDKVTVKGNCMGPIKAPSQRGIILIVPARVVN